MKIRIGFVSNSSSASYIIDSTTRKFKTVREIAKYMLNSIKEDFNESFIDLMLRRLNKLQNKDTPITFQSYNYDTYILKDDKLILIETCNNHDWNIDINDYHKLPKDKILKYEYDMDDIYISDKEYFYHLGASTFLKEDFSIPYNKRYCKKHYCEKLINKNNKIICPICYGEKEKIRRLLLNE